MTLNGRFTSSASRGIFAVAELLVKLRERDTDYMHQQRPSPNSALSATTVQAARWRLPVMLRWRPMRVALSTVHLWTVALTSACGAYILSVRLLTLLTMLLDGLWFRDGQYSRYPRYTAVPNFTVLVRPWGSRYTVAVTVLHGTI